MIAIEVDNQRIQAKAGESILSACSRAGIRIPTLCHFGNLSPTGACRICVVEVDGSNSLVPSCASPALEGMRIQTHSPRVLRARRMVLELLLAEHPDDCLYCVRNTRCGLQNLAGELGIRGRRFQGSKSRHPLDTSSPALVRDPEKCILCGRCVRVCDEVQGVGAIELMGRGSGTRVGTVFHKGLNASACVTCGQCIVTCPTGALSERSAVQEVWAALNDPGRYVVAQHAPALSISLGEEFGVRPGVDAAGAMREALRTLGFRKVFDVSFAADLAVMEVAAELLERIREGGPLPLLTSCSPGWVRFVEEFHPGFLGHLSTCKSPQQMLGALIKSHFAESEGIPPETVFCVSLLPCVAGKFEAGRPEMARGGRADVDAVLTTRELAGLMRLRGCDLSAIAPDFADEPFAERSTAGKLSGVAGGMAEAVLRTAHFLRTGNELAGVKVQAMRGLDGVKEMRIRLGDLELGVAAVSGLGHARALLEQIRKGRDDLHFVEVMTCPGGCVNGGGQPLGAGPEALKARVQALYAIDRDGRVRTSHANAAVQELYKTRLERPLSARSRELLHTSFSPREVVR